MPLEMQYDGLHRVISGGQTGADQGALIAAWRLGVQTGGTAPAAYRVQGGYAPLLEAFGLNAVGDYASRTRENILNSDGTLIVAQNLRSPGTLKTINMARALEKPLLLVNTFHITQQVETADNDRFMRLAEDLGTIENNIATFVIDNQIRVLNVAGNREFSTRPTDGYLTMCQLADLIVTVGLTRIHELGKLLRQE